MSETNISRSDVEAMAATMRAKAWQSSRPKKQIYPESHPCWAASDMLVSLRDRLDAAEAELQLLQDILDSRPAINAGLPESYIRWSQGVYSGEFVRACMNAKE